MAIGTGIALLGGALISAIGSKKSSDKQARAVKTGEAAALAENARQFDLVRSDTAATRALGAGATERLSRLYGYAPPQAAIAGSGGSPGSPGTLSPVGARIAGRFFGREPTTYDNETGQPVGTSPAVAGQPDMSAFFESPDYQFNLAEGQKAIDRSKVAQGGLLSGAAVKGGIRFASGMASREYGSFVDRLMQQAGLGSSGVAASAAAGANSAGNVANVSMNGANTRASIYANNGANVNNAIMSGVSNWMLSKYLGGGGGGGGGGVPAGYPGMG